MANRYKAKEKVRINLKFLFRLINSIQFNFIYHECIRNNSILEIIIIL